MFSATFPDEVQESAQEFLADDYLFLTIGLVGGACSDVKQVNILCFYFGLGELLSGAHNRALKCLRNLPLTNLCTGFL